MILEKLKKDFFERDGRVVAEELLGKFLIRKYEENILIGKIVETEAYIGKIDKACHAYGGRKTPRIMPLYSACGIAYVYSIYGMYHCFNVITGEENDPQGVLIRAIEPIEGLDEISKNRFKKVFNELKKKEILNLTSGPSKLCIALNIDKKLNNHSIFNDELYIAVSNSIEKIQTVKSKRVGIDYSEEAKDFLWRYYVKNNKFVSVLDK